MKQKLYHNTIIWVLSTVFLGCSPTLNPAPSITRTPNNECQFVSQSDKFPELPYSWNYHLPVHFELHYSVPPEYRNFFYESADLWNTRINAKIITIENNTINPQSNLNTISMERDGKNLIYWLNRSEIPILDPDISYKSTLAITRKIGFKNIFYVQLTNTDIIIVEDTLIDNINNTRQYLTQEDLRAFEENSIKNTISHEFGHALGLADNPNSPLMRLSSDIETDLVKQSVSEDDINNLSCIYDLDRLRRQHPLESSYII